MAGGLCFLLLLTISQTLAHADRPFFAPLQPRQVSAVSSSSSRPATSVVASVQTGPRGAPLVSASFSVPGSFPTSDWASYYAAPTGAAQPQPVVVDNLLGTTYASDLTSPTNLPANDTVSADHPQATSFIPGETFSPDQLASIVSTAQQQIGDIITSTQPTWTNCTKCQAALGVAQELAKLAPEAFPSLLTALCVQYKYSTPAQSCYDSYSALAYGSPYTALIQNVNVAGLDGRYLCNNFFTNTCSLPPVQPLNLTGYFAKPKPLNAAAPQPSGKRLKVLHLSDFHIDPRYFSGAEANCSDYLCCRQTSKNANSAQSPLLPAPRFGAFKCDSPWYLAEGILQAISPLTGTSPLNLGDKSAPLDFSIFTGDLVSHDNENLLSRAYVEETEAISYYLFAKYLGNNVYVTLGNHDSYNEALDAPQSISAPYNSAFSWNYDHVSSLWQNYGFIGSDVANASRFHYGGYSVKTSYGLRIISLNTDFWYKANIFNYVNITNPDQSGMLRYLADELQAAEDAQERVWIIGHVLSGWDGSNPLGPQTDLFQAIVDRYSPHCVANVFFGHTHEDLLSIVYANNATVMNFSTALTPVWIAPSVTPLTNLNSGFRVYEVDAQSFDIMEAYTYYANVSTFASLDQTGDGPSYNFEYSTRSAYDATGQWPTDAPLNATFWHQVTERMETDANLVSLFNSYQGKSSILTPNCTNSDCQAAKICYMRSASAPIARQNCKMGYGSVQSAFKPAS